MLNESWMVDKNSNLQSWFFYHLEIPPEISKIKCCVDFILKGYNIPYKFLPILK